MSGFIVLAAIGALIQQSAPHPSTLAPYRAPAIRPFEPTPEFGREPAQGDANGDLHRRPLEAPVTVETYVRSYEFSQGDSEVAYDQGVASAEIRVDQSSGPLNGHWQVLDEQGRGLFGLLLDDDGHGPVEGGWRGAPGSGAATVEGTTVNLERLGQLTLTPDGRGWRGTLTEGGRTRAVSLSRRN